MANDDRGLAEGLKTLARGTVGGFKFGVDKTKYLPPLWAIAAGMGIVVGATGGALKAMVLVANDEDVDKIAARIGRLSEDLKGKLADFVRANS